MLRTGDVKNCNFILNIEVRLRLTTYVSISARHPECVGICKNKYFTKEQLKTPDFFFLTLQKFEI